jgi:hypothetical protein
MPAPSPVSPAHAAPTELPRPPTPGSFEHLLRYVEVSLSDLVRLSRFPRTEPWWSRGAYRFDGPPAGEPGSFGTLYVAADLETAFCESVIHACSWFDRGAYHVSATSLNSRYVVTFKRPGADVLRLVDFTGPALKRLGLNSDLTTGSDYTMPMAWAQAIHEADPSCDGIWYVSRQHNTGRAAALFERSGVRASRRRLLAGKSLRALCDVFGVVEVRA